MWFFTEEEKMLQEAVADFARSRVAPVATKFDEQEEFPSQHFQGLAQLGILGITAPQEYGGAGQGCVAATIAMEELGSACASTALSYLAHSILAVNNIATNGSHEQKQKYLPALINGTSIGGMGMSEPDAGTDALGMKTKAIKKGDHYILNGTKMWITNATVGQIYYVYAKTGESKKDVSTFIVEKSFPGFSMGKKISKMGMRASPTGELIFENCQVPATNLVGKENQSIAAMLRNLDIERITIAGISLGIARASLEAARQYAQERKQFGKALGDFQMIQKMLADGQAQYDACRSLCYQAAKMWDLGQLNGSASRTWGAKAKLVTAQMATQVSLDAIQILGGYGYSREFPVERYMRDAKLVEIGAGTNEMMRILIARELLPQLKFS